MFTFAANTAEARDAGSLFRSIRGPGDMVVVGDGADVDVGEETTALEAVRLCVTDRFAGPMAVQDRETVGDIVWPTVVEPDTDDASVQG